ncbi:hypothetical protein V8C35DRAFT_291351 [Trichoderma chlorosporum]
MLRNIFDSAAPKAMDCVLVEAQARGISGWRLMGPAAELRVGRDKENHWIRGPVLFEAEHESASGRHH